MLGAAMLAMSVLLAFAVPVEEIGAAEEEEA